MEFCANVKPKIDPSVFIADTATVIGDVEIGKNSSVWYGAVIRSDGDRVRLGEEVNVQDGAVIHEDAGYPVIVGDRVTIGHKAIVHGCTIGNDVLIGMGAILLSGCRIGNDCLIAAGALVTASMDIPDGSMVMGAPAKTIKPLSDELREEIAFAANEYAELGREYKAGRYQQAR